LDFLQEWCEKKGFLDGVLVNEGRAIMWLEEVVFKLRNPLTKAQKMERERKKAGLDPIEAKPITYSEEDVEWAKEIGMSEEDLYGLRLGDAFNPELDSVVEPENEIEGEGDLLKWGTINTSYISVIAELYEMQVTLGLNKEPTFRGPAFNAMTKAREMEENDAPRERFEDRGADGINASYSDEEFERINRALLKKSVDKPAVSHWPLLRLCCLVRFCDFLGRCSPVGSCSRVVGMTPGV
jgi:hypothetical protein